MFVSVSSRCLPVGILHRKERENSDAVLVAFAAIHPPGAPASFAAVGGTVRDAAKENALGCFAEFIRGRLPSTGILHLEQDVAETPTLALVPFLRFHSLTLEVDVVDQGVNAVSMGGDLVEVLAQSLAIRPICCCRFHLRQSLLEALHDKAGLHRHRVREKGTELLHLGRILLGEELVAGLPGATLGLGNPAGHGDALLLHEADQGREALFEGPGPAVHIPDEMTDPE